jgi:competence protein ComEA
MTEWLERNRGLVIVTFINLALIVGFSFWLKQPTTTPIEIISPLPTSTSLPSPTSTPSLVRVYVAGAVSHPDVYWLDSGSIVKDAVAAAGGASHDADLNRINLAQELYDQQQIYVPRQGETNPPPPVTDGETVSSTENDSPVGIVNINTATLEELDSLSGIGPALGQRIIDYREANGPFASIEEIMLVSGIGEACFEKIKDRITVGD